MARIYIDPLENPAYVNALANRMIAPAPQAPARPKSRGFLADALAGVARPFGYLLDTAIGNPTRELAAQFTGNEKALRNARRRTNKTLGLGESGTDIGNALKRFGGESTQALLTVAAPGPAQGLRGALGAGAGYGGAQALSEDGSTLEDVLKGSGFGAVTGGAVHGGGKLLGGVLRKGANEGVKTGARGAVERSANSSLGKAWGIRQGEKIGSRIVSTKRIGDLQRFVIDDLKVPKAANADIVKEYAENFSKETGTAIGSLISSSKTRINVKPLVATIENDFNKVIGAGGPQNPAAADILRQLKKVKTPNDLWQVRRNVDDFINFNRNPDTSIPGMQNLGEKARKAINKVLNDIEGYKPLSQRYNKAQDIIELSAKAAKTPRGAKLPGFLGGMFGEQVQSLRSAIGQAGLSGASKPKSLRGATSALPNAVNYGLIQGLQSPKNMDSTNTAAQYQNINSNIDELSNNNDELSSGAVDNSPFALGNVDNNIESILANGGDFKDVNDYISLVGALQKIRSPENKPMKKTEGQRARDEAAQLTQDALGMFEQGSLITGPLARLEGAKQLFNAGDPETANFNATISALRASIAKARAGTSFTPNEERLLNQYAPKTGDSGQTLMVKLQNLQRIFSAAAEREYGVEYQPDSLTEALGGLSQ